MEFLRSFLKHHFVGKTSGGITKCWLFSQALQVGAFLVPCHTLRHLPFCVGKEEWETWESVLIFKSSFKKQRTLLCFIWFCLFDRRVNYSEHWRKWDCHKNKLHADVNWNPPLSYSWSPFKWEKKLLPNEVATCRNDFCIWKSEILPLMFSCRVLFFFKKALILWDLALWELQLYEFCTLFVSPLNMLKELKKYVLYKFTYTS